MLFDFLKRNHFVKATATVPWLWGTWGSAHVEKDEFHGKVDGLWEGQVPASNNVGLPKPGGAVWSADRSQVRPTLKMTRFF
jgi:hypothetical protein